jgi:ankyrin repeat protein
MDGAALRGGHEVVVKLLLEKEGVDPDSQDSGGWTPLWWAAKNGHDAVVKRLLEKGIDVDSKVGRRCHGPRGTSMKRW